MHNEMFRTHNSIPAGGTQWVENVCYTGNNGLTMGPPLIAAAPAAFPTNLSFVNFPNKFSLVQGKEDAIKYIQTGMITPFWREMGQRSWDFETSART